MTIEIHWPHIKKLFKHSFRSSLHYAIATVNKDGEPHVTPIGSLILGKPGCGYYFEEFTKNLPQNLQENKQVCILAVNSNRWLWVKSLIMGEFSNPPAIRLFGRVSDVREATTKEVELFQRRVKPFKYTQGYSLIWSNMRMVRDIKFSRVEPVHIGEMTRKIQNYSLDANKT